MGKTIVGLMLIDAPHSALNNAGLEPGERTENIVRTKVIKRGSDVYPYVSGQAVRYWWRQTLNEKFNWNMSPLEREEKIVYSEANPLKYEDDDVFGYMRAPKGRGSETVTRLSPLKVSPLISVIPQRPVQDYGTASRHEGDPVPYEHEFYSTVLKGIFSLDVERVGVFSSENRTGYKNITEKLAEELENSDATNNDGLWIIPFEKRKKRTKETIKALPYLFGGAMSARHLTDVSPKILVMTLIDGGNHIFMNIVNESDGKVHFSSDAILEVTSDYKKQILTPVYIGKRKGFLDEIDSNIKENLLEKDDNNLPEFVYDSVNEVVDKFTKKIEEFME